MEMDKELIDRLLGDYQKPEDLIGENGLLKQLTRAIVERALQAELTTYLGYEKHSPEGHNSGNSRNGVSSKQLKGDFGEVEIEVPRDRQASFEPKLVAKGQTRFAGFDDKILSLDARGMTTREIQGHLEEMYQVEVSPALISNVTDAVIEEVKAWQTRPLDAGMIDSDFYYLLAECMVKIDPTNSKDALMELNRAIASNSRSVSARSMRGKLLLEEGQPKQAVADLKLALQIDPDSRSAVYNLARAYSALGRTAEAKSLFKQLSTHNTDSLNELSERRLKEALAGNSSQ
jgi:Transposase, Mutator family/Tetratricopeptide repeat